MKPVECSMSYFRAMLPEWHMVAKGAEDRSGVLVALWDPRWASMRAFGVFGGILLMSFF